MQVQEMLIILTLLGIATPILCQDFMEPDVKFGDQNDRFDVGPIIQHSKAYFNDEPSYRSRIESSMRADDDLMDAIPERRSGIDNRRRSNNGLAKDTNNEHAEATPKRKSGIESNMKANNKFSEVIAQMRSKFPQRRQDYAYHDKMEPDKDPERANYEANLKAYAQKNKKGRRFKNIIEELRAGNIYRSRKNEEIPREFIDPDIEILMQHAVPINAKFQGYLTAPLVE